MAMAATQVGIVYDTLSGNVRVIRLPDDDAQLDDPSLNYAGCTRVKLMRADYDSLLAIPMNVANFALAIIPNSAVATPIVIGL